MPLVEHVGNKKASNKHDNIVNNQLDLSIISRIGILETAFYFHHYQ